MSQLAARGSAQLNRGLSSPQEAPASFASSGGSESQLFDLLCLYKRRVDEIANPKPWSSLTALEPTVQVWVDRSVAKAVRGLLEEPASSQFLSNLETLRISKDVALSAPPADAVFDLASMLLHALGDESNLDARDYVAWTRVCCLDWSMDRAVIEEVQSNVVQSFIRGSHIKTKQKRMSRTRMAMIGGAALAGGGLLAATGAASAPLLAGAALAAHATGTAAFLGSASGMTAVAGSLGALGAARTGYKMAKRTGGLREFGFLPVKDSSVPSPRAEIPPLILTLGISGWMQTDAVDALQAFWGSALPVWMGERETLMFDRKELVSYGHALKNFVINQTAQNVAVGGMAIAAGAAGAAMATAVTAPMMALAVEDAVDSPYALAKHKSKLAGQELARALTARALGHRPVRLVGFGFGACCIFYCLEALATSGEAGLVADACLFGTPMRLSPVRWAAVRKVVAGNLVNCFNPKDAVLKYLMKVSTKPFPAAGVHPVEVDGVVDVEINATHYQIGTTPLLLKDLLNSAMQPVSVPFQLRPPPPPPPVRPSAQVSA